MTRIPEARSVTNPPPVEPGYPLGWCPLHRRPTEADGSCPLCAGEVRPSRPEYVVVYVVAAVALVVGAILVGHMWEGLEVTADPPGVPASPGGAADGVAGPLSPIFAEAERAQKALAKEAASQERARSGSDPSGTSHRRAPKSRPMRQTPGPGASGQTDPRQLPPGRVVVRPVSIIMYMAHWCPACVRAQKWLRSQKIPHQAIHVDSDKAGAAELRRLNPRGGIPTFNIDGRVLVGFSPQALSTAIEMARERRAHGP